MDISFIFPCLNEEETLAHCINELKISLDSSNLNYEIIVADNGSNDTSREIANKNGAKVVLVPQKGYGAALRGGFAEAKGKYIAFADADGSYPIGEHIVDMYTSAHNNNADMVIASRIRGRIEKGAMPFLHRWLGTPVLTTSINLLFRGKLSDCNSGFRLMKRDSYCKWDVKSDGMEFASELLIKALINKANIVEIKGGLRKDMRSRPPHLKTWRDGMRHLLFILSEKPQLFEKSGLFIIFFSLILQFLSIILGPVKIFGMHIFSIHSNLVLILLSLAGIQSYLFSCHIYVSSSDKSVMRLTNSLIHMNEANVFLIVLFTCFLEALGIIFIFLIWGILGFDNLSGNITNLLIILMQIMIIIGFSSFGILGIHILKRKT